MSHVKNTEFIERIGESFDIAINTGNHEEAKKLIGELKPFSYEDAMALEEELLNLPVDTFQIPSDIELSILSPFFQ